MIEDEQYLDDCYKLITDLMYDAGKLVIEGFNKATKNVSTKSGSWDLVTEYDGLVENLFITEILKKYPNHKFIAEETASENDLTDDPTWIIDPIDGTNNFVHGFPLICMSLALAFKKEIVIGIVYNPILNEVYSARKGKGAFLNGNKMECSKVDKLEEGIYVHEGSFVRVEKVREKNIKRMYGVASRSQGFRSLGCAALTLAYVARGCLDCYAIDDLYPWDVAAGALLIQESGGFVYRIDGKPFHFMDPKLLCGSTDKLCKELIECIRKSDALNLTIK